MPQIITSLFYEFHRLRVVSRAGQPLLEKQNIEIGPPIAREEAAHQVRNGKDVYTARKNDAFKLASHLYASNPVFDAPTKPNYFPHFHPGGEHPKFAEDQLGRPRAEEGPGHVFFGSRGEGYVPRP
jgi:hypothetical protein